MPLRRNRPESRTTANYNQVEILGFSGANASADWHDIRDPYGLQQIQAIEDTDHPTHQKQLTSIPSPFATIDLVLTAIRVINSRINSKINSVISSGIIDNIYEFLDGKTIYHKIVSDWLDFGELLFNYDLLRDKHNFEIIKWNREDDLKTLEKSNTKGHREFSDAVKLFLDQDEKAYNFDTIREVSLIRYNNLPDNNLNIIGGISPATIFFPMTNNLLNKMNALALYGRQPFFHSEDPNFRFISLYNRDPEFIKFLLIYIVGHSLNLNRFTDIENPINDIFKYISHNVNKRGNTDLVNLIDNQTACLQEYSRHRDLTLGGGQIISILETPLKTKIRL